MECVICKTQNAEGAKYCTNCGLRLDPTMGPVREILEASIRREVQDAFQTYQKDQRIAELDVTEKVVNRLLGWGKIFGIVLGILIAIAGFIGIKGVVDFADGARQAKDQLEKAKGDAVTDLGEHRKSANQTLDDARDRAIKDIGAEQAKNKELQTAYDKLRADLPELQNIAASVRKLNDQKNIYDDRIAALTQEVQKLGKRPLPPPTGQPPFRLSLGGVVGDATVESIKKSGKLVFHVAGNTGGVQRPDPQILVAGAMTSQCQLGEAADRPAFLYLLGNVVNLNGEASEYSNQFYKPYLHYPLPIFAIPGNHDADNRPSKDPAQFSLAAFVDNFCSRIPHKTAEAGDATRMSMTQPNVYWTLQTPYATIIGLYTNVPTGGYVDDDQKKWLIKELEDAPADKAVILAMHYSVFTEDMSSASRPSSMGSMLDDVFQKTKRRPDLVLSAHANLYIRYLRDQDGRQVPYVVAGTGGYWSLKRLNKPPDSPMSGVKVAAYDGSHYGFLRISVTTGKIVGEYFTVQDEGGGTGKGPVVVADRFEVDLAIKPSVKANG
jgi:hypothetical protein